MPSIEEAEQMLGTRDTFELVRRFREHGAKNVVIKMGDKGVYVSPINSPSFYKGIYRVNVVNTTGAGDAWCAGFIAGLVKNLPLEECALLGAGNSALCVAGIGATSGLKNYEDTRRFLRDAQYIRAENE
jgi:sugar/nucleoside kinase (ribokinase family)